MGDNTVLVDWDVAGGGELIPGRYSSLDDVYSNIISVTFVGDGGKETTIKVPVGISMLEAAHENDIELEDVMYLHDKPRPENCPQKLYDAPVDALEQVGDVD
ncbi:hypothetical protein AgCh_012548 [Apium graveolens]